MANPEQAPRDAPPACATCGAATTLRAPIEAIYRHSDIRLYECLACGFVTSREEKRERPRD